MWKVLSRKENKKKNCNKSTSNGEKRKFRAALLDTYATPLKASPQFTPLPPTTNEEMEKERKTFLKTEI